MERPAPDPRRRLEVDPVRPDPEAVGRAADVLRAGGLVAFPTETVYGLGASLWHRGALRRVFRVKGRPATDPLIVHVPDPQAARPLVASWPPAADALAARFWPGPLTLVLSRSSRVPDEVTAGGPTVGIRVPAHPVATALLRSAGVPVAAPSANRFGRVSPTEAAHVLDELGGSVDLVLDAGATPLGIESTVVDLTGDRPDVLRPGGVPVEDLEAVVGPVRAEARAVVPESRPAAGPGRFLGHYAPRTPVVLVEGDDTVRRALISGLGRLGVSAVPLDLPGAPAEAARTLYAALRRADDSGAAVVLALTVEPSGLGRAVNDRLFRAAHGRVVAGAGPADVDRVAALLGR